MTVTTFAGARCPACVPLATGHRLRGHSLPRLQAAQRQRRCRSRRQLIARAAASGLPSDDPYKVRLSVDAPVIKRYHLNWLKLTCSPVLQVLELSSGADSAAIQRQYNKLKREKRGNDDAINKIEAAHSTLMMRNLSARMQESTAHQSAALTF